MSEPKEKRKPISLNELKRRRTPIRNTLIEYQENLTSLEHFALWITKRVGSMGFFIIILVWTIMWFSWNTFAPSDMRFDVYPSFVLWLFISNVIQLFLMPLIMVGQNLEDKHTEARAQADFEINLKSEEEIGAILEHLEYQDELILKILRHHDDDIQSEE